MIKLNIEQSRHAVIYFLDIYYKQTKSKDTALIIQELNKKKSESLIWQDWEQVLKEINSARNSGATSLLPENIIFEGMIKFLEKFYSRTQSDDIGSLLSDLLHAGYGATADPASWYEWQESLKRAEIIND